MRDDAHFSEVAGREVLGCLPSESMVGASVGLQLFSNNTAIKALCGKKVMIKWKDGEPAAEAKLLGFGKCQT